MDRILVPLDGSTLAEAALPMAGALARGWRAEVVLLRVLRPRPAPGVEADTQREAETYLGGMVEDLVSRCLPAVRWRVWYGEPDRAIAEAAEATEASLILMSTHGRSGLSRFRFGSVAEGVVRIAPVPALLVRGAPTWSLDGLRPVLVPLDGSERSAAVLPVVEHLAGPLHLAVHLLHAVEPLPPAEVPEVAVRLPEFDRLRRAEAEAYLDRVAATIESPSLAVTREVRSGPALETILACAREIGAGLVAMSTHGRSGLPRVLLGSVAECVVRGARAPVLLWKAPAARLAERHT